MNDLKTKTTDELREKKNYVKLNGDYTFKAKNEKPSKVFLSESKKQALKELKINATEQYNKFNEVAKFFGMLEDANGALTTNVSNNYSQSVEFMLGMDQDGENCLLGASELIVYCVNKNIELKIQNPWENDGVWMKIKLFSEKELLSLKEESKLFLESNNTFEGKDLGYLKLHKKDGSETRTTIKCNYKNNNPYFAFFLRSREVVENDVEELFDATELITIEDLIRCEVNSFVTKMEGIIYEAENKDEVFEAFLSSMLKNKSKYSETLMFLFLPIVYRFLGRFYFPM